MDCGKAPYFAKTLITSWQDPPSPQLKPPCKRTYISALSLYTQRAVKISAISTGSLPNRIISLSKKEFVE